MPVVIASGGTLVELLRDSVTLLLPTNRTAISKALTRLQVYPLLLGFRGSPPGDIEAVVEAVLAIAALAQDKCDHILEIEVNPLMVRPNNMGVVAVDALVRSFQVSE